MSEQRARIETFRDGEAVARAAAEEFIRLAARAIAERGFFAVALSGGSTPKRLYQILAEPENRARVAWDKVHLFWGDERPVPPDHEESNYHMTNEALLSTLSLAADHVHRMPAARADHDAAAREHQEEIANLFGVAVDGPPPSFDLVFLGMGPDGHTASLFPETAALAETERWVVPNFVPKFDATRMTMTAPLINAAKEVLFLVVGESKTDRLVEVLEGPSDPDRLPSQRIKPTNGELVFYTDEAAVAKLSTK
ncbi:6-phosphogluconolactonase [Planctomycetes bacterium Pan216]|uniref:6-phosphogluconolactonase n=1 Tax=Kolteria novifilia TaxID=2527975 RepID=A0A518B2G8_9BACT|nr:6-phosphogluconolactonase [Planctomycetes bacterium Pan216]